MSIAKWLAKNAKGMGNKVGGAVADIGEEALPFAALGSTGVDMAKGFAKRNPKTAGGIAGLLGGGTAVHELDEMGDDDEETAKIDAILERLGILK